MADFINCSIKLLCTARRKRSSTDTEQFVDVMAAITIRVNRLNTSDLRNFPPPLHRIQVHKCCETSMKKVLIFEDLFGSRRFFLLNRCNMPTLFVSHGWASQGGMHRSRRGARPVRISCGIRVGIEFFS
ncbi:hypothetical protein JTE90_004824 [Oedothorax gibbosus]|uniref:Uncharacterized protein n=1 Tax=Oedothorax gibbosus TaxID=931172 RepID=A0AAV6UQN5_9ARAC|nr:hypothetical protein JTE90_004824 [Oedothorax gibbosus]